MDEILHAFVENYLTEEIQEEVYKSFNLFDFFDYPLAYTELMDILTQESQLDRDQMRDAFMEKLNEKLDYILEQHRVKLVDDVALHHKVQILYGLGHLQKLSDYTPTIRVLESLESNEYQMALILSDITHLNETELMTCLESVSDESLSLLKKYIYNQEQTKIDPTQTTEIYVKQLKLLEQIHPGSLGALLMSSGVLLGQAFSSYTPFISEDLRSDDTKTTALNFLSCLYLSHDGLNSTLATYRKYAHQFLGDLDQITRVEVQLLQMIAQVSEHLAHLNAVKNTP